MASLVAISEAVSESGSCGMESRTGESAELLTGRPVEGGIRFRSPEVAMGSGSGAGVVKLFPWRLLLEA